MYKVLLIAIGTAIVLLMLNPEEPQPNPVDQAIEISIQTSALVYDPRNNSGGSGVVIYSDLEKTLVLSNSHVCTALNMEFAKIKLYTGEFQVQAHKLYPIHDLCLLKLHNAPSRSVRITSVPLGASEPIVITGFPGFARHRPIITEVGFSSNNFEFEDVVPVRDCTQEEYADETGENYAMCVITGKVFEYRTFKYILVTFRVHPGFSGSGILNMQGELVAVLFIGGRGATNYGGAVPTVYIWDFLYNSDSQPWIYSR